MQAVHIPHELVNDESVLLMDWLVADGAEVMSGQPIAVIETSKTTAEIEAPCAGFMRRGASKGTEVPVGSIICHIAANAAEAAALADVEPVSGTAASSSPVGASARFSRRALELIETHGLSRELFDGKGLVREGDVLAVIEGKPEPLRSIKEQSTAPLSDSSAPVAAAGVPVRTEKLPRMKQLEARYLASGQHNTIASSVTVTCPTAGLKAAARLQPQLGDNASAVIIYETARLLRKYPVFNAFYHQGAINYYEQVNIGLAVDADRGLKVPVIHRADEKEMLGIAREVEDLMMAYLNDEIPVASLAGGTFTITNLAGEEVFLFHPLINQGQAAILGVGAEYRPARSEHGYCSLILAFDHHLAEGRAAARFLRELRDRISSYAGAIHSGEEACSHCQRSASELARRKVPLLRQAGEQTFICRDCLMRG